MITVNQTMTEQVQDGEYNLSDGAARQVRALLTLYRSACGGQVGLEGVPPSECPRPSSLIILLHLVLFLSLVNKRDYCYFLVKDLGFYLNISHPSPESRL